MVFKHYPDFAERPPKSKRFKAILVVDDDRQLVQALQWILADQNFLVDKAYDGQEAILKVKANDYDAVICDVMMPRLNGNDFYHVALQMRPSLCDRFIFITGFAADRKIHLFLCQNHLKYFIKPFRIQELIDCVKQVVGEAPSTKPPEFPDSNAKKSTGF